MSAAREVTFSPRGTVISLRTAESSAIISDTLARLAFNISLTMPFPRDADCLFSISANDNTEKERNPPPGLLVAATRRLAMYTMNRLLDHTLALVAFGTDTGLGLAMQDGWLHAGSERCET